MVVTVKPVRCFQNPETLTPVMDHDCHMFHMDMETVIAGYSMTSCATGVSMYQQESRREG